MTDLLLFLKVLGCLVAWSTTGVIGARWLHCLWFSGGLRDLRKDYLPDYALLLGMFLGPLNLLIAGTFYAFGLGRDWKGQP